MKRYLAVFVLVFLAVLVASIYGDKTRPEPDPTPEDWHCSALAREASRATDVDAARTAIDEYHAAGCP